MDRFGTGLFCVDYLKCVLVVRLVHESKVNARMIKKYVFKHLQIDLQVGVQMVACSPQGTMKV